jgi:hypothetical protein
MVDISKKSVKDRAQLAIVRGPGSTIAIHGRTGPEDQAQVHRIGKGENNLTIPGGFYV